MTEATQDLLARLAGFTPGPWDAALERGCHGIVASILGDEFNMIALIGNDTDTPDREPMRFANAAIIAAAPDLHRIATEQVAEIARLRDALIAALVTAEAQAKTARDALVECRDDLDAYSQNEYPSDHPVHMRYRQRDYAANPARIALAMIQPTDTSRTDAAITGVKT